MKLELKIYGCLCATEMFRINNVEADSRDFGILEDIDAANAEDYCCGNMSFERTKSNKRILSKYKISEKEYSEICDELEEGLSFGCCCLCS